VKRVMEFDESGVFGFRRDRQDALRTRGLLNVKGYGEDDTAKYRRVTRYVYPNPDGFNNKRARFVEMPFCGPDPTPSIDGFPYIRKRKILSFGKERRHSQASLNVGLGRRLYRGELDGTNLFDNPQNSPDMKASNQLFGVPLTQNDHVYSRFTDQNDDIPDSIIAVYRLDLQGPEVCMCEKVAEYRSYDWEHKWRGDEPSQPGQGEMFGVVIRRKCIRLLYYYGANINGEADSYTGVLPTARFMAVPRRPTGGAEWPTYGLGVDAYNYEPMNFYGDNWAEKSAQLLLPSPSPVMPPCVDGETTMLYSGTEGNRNDVADIDADNIVVGLERSFLLQAEGLVTPNLVRIDPWGVFPADMQDFVEALCGRMSRPGDGFDMMIDAKVYLISIAQATEWDTNQTYIQGDEYGIKKWTKVDEYLCGISAKIRFFA